MALSRQVGILHERSAPLGAVIADKGPEVGDDRDVVVVAGARTPFVKANTLLAGVHAVDLGRIVVREAIERADVDVEDIDEVIVGNIGSPPDAANITKGDFFSIARNMPVTTASPAAMPSEPPMKRKSCTAATTGRPSSVPSPTSTASLSSVSERASLRRSV